MGLFQLNNSCVFCPLDFLKLYLDSKSRLPIPEFSGYYCNSKGGCKFFVAHPF